MFFVPRILWLKRADYHFLALVSETSAEISSHNPPLSYFPAVFLFLTLHCHFLLCVVHGLFVLMRCTKLLYAIVREQPSGHLFHVCLISKWRCHLHNLIVLLQRAKCWKISLKHSWLTMLDTGFSLCIVSLEAAWKVLQRAPLFL